MRKVIPRIVRLIWSAEKYSVKQPLYKLGKFD